MSSSFDVVTSGISIASFSIQVFDEIIQGYQFWSKVSSVPQEHRHLLLRIEIEENRFETFRQKAGLAGPAASPLCHELAIRMPLMKKIVTEVNTILLEAKQRSKKYKQDTVGNIKWAAGEQEDLKRLGAQLEYYNSQLLALLDPVQKEEQRLALEIIYRKQILIEQNVQHLRQLDEAFDITRTSWIKEVNDESRTQDPPLNSLVREVREQQIKQQNYLRELISIKEYLRSSLSQFDNGHPFDDIKELPLFDTRTADRDPEVKRCYIRSKQQWIEWRDREPKTKHNETRIQLLVHLLQKRKPSSFRSPTCVGYTKRSFSDNTIQYGLVLTYPEQLPNAQLSAKLSTLRELLQQEDAEPSLSDKISFCTVVAKCIHDFHTTGWLHKGIRSTNIIFMIKGDNAVEFDEPYLVGFELARPSLLKDLTIRPKTIALNEEIYRHPNAQSSDGASLYRKSYDLYSLGIIFIEIIMWKPIEEVLGLNFNSTEQSEIQQVYDKIQETQYNRKIAIAAGNSFAQLVNHCLRADAIDIRANDENNIDLDMEDFMSQKIVAPLNKLKTALSAMA